MQRAFSRDACCQTCSHNGSSPTMNLVQTRATVARSRQRNFPQTSDLCQASTGKRTGQTAHKSAPSPSLCGHTQGTAVEVAWRSQQPLSALDLRTGGVVPAQTMIAGRSFTVALGVDTLAVALRGWHSRQSQKVWVSVSPAHDSRWRHLVRDCVACHLESAGHGCVVAGED